MNPTYDFSGQVALVTGASSGMGLATAEAFSDSAAAVVLADINEQALQAAAEKLTSAGRKVLDRGLRCLGRGAGREHDRADRDAFRQARYGLQQRGHPGAAERCCGRDRGELRSGERNKPSRCLGLHEARIATDADARKRSHRELLVARRSRRITKPRRLSRLQARRHRTDEECGDGVRATRHPDQRDLPRHINTPIVSDMLAKQADAMKEIMRDQPIGRLGESDEIAAAVLWLCSPGRQLRPRRRATGGRRVYCPLNTASAC